MANKPTLMTEFMRDHGARQVGLDRARNAARLVDPGLIPEEGHTKDSELHQNYQSIGPWGMNNLEGVVLQAMFPPLFPWLAYPLAPEILYDPRTPAALIEVAQQELFLREAITQALLESGSRSKQYRGRPVGFRTAQRQSISQVLGTGDSLERMDENYQIRVYRRPEYVTRRDGSGQVIYHITNELIDVASLSAKQLEATALNIDDVESLTIDQRMKPLLTRCMWQPRTEKWMIEQEVNGHIIPLDKEGNDKASEDRVSPFFSTPFKLLPGEDYGRGFVEVILMGDLNSLEYLSKAQLEWAGMVAKLTPVIDEGSNIRPRDLQKPSGVPIMGRVVNGQVQDMAFLNVNKGGDGVFFISAIQDIISRLGRAMLIGSDAVRDSERTTRYEVQETVVRALDGALGGLYTPMADCKQLPIARRVVYQAERDKIMRPLPEKAYRTEILTGAAALSRGAKVGAILEIAQVAQQLGPEAVAKIDPRALVDVLARYRNVHEPGIIKTNERLDQERRQQQADELRMQAAGQAIQTTGNIVEANATRQPTQVA
jgi:hypothetical protein